MIEKIKQLTRLLYPRGRAFWMPFGGFFEKLHIGLAQSENRAVEDAKSILDSILPDNDGFTAQDATDWERRLGLIVNESLDLTTRKLAIERKMKHPGDIPARQHYLYVEGQLQAAGFNVYVFENRFPDYPDGYYTITPESLFPLFGDELISNGAFDTPADWSLTGTGISITGGELSFSTASNGAYAQQQLATIIPSDSGSYRVSMRIATLEDLIFRVIASDGSSVVYEEIITDPSTIHTFDVDSSMFGGDDGYYVRIVIDTTGGSDTGIVDDVSMKLIIPVSTYPGLVETYYGVEFQNIVANNIDQSKDANFDVGANYRSTFFVGGTPLGTFADVDETRVQELRQLILKLKPAQTICYLLINETY